MLVAFVSNQRIDREGMEMGQTLGVNATIDLSKETILVDRTYQRNPNPRRIKEIADNFDELLFQRPVVNRRSNGKLYCVTGQHRLIAASVAGRETVKVILTQGMTREQEAHYFRRDAETTVRVPVSNRFAAAVVEGDVGYVRMENVLNDHGYSAVGKQEYVKCGAIHAVKKLDSMGVLDSSLSLIEEIWPELPKYKTRDGKLLRGMGEFINKYGKVYELAYAKDSLGFFEPNDLIALASKNAEQAHPVGRNWVCDEIVRQYNRKAPRGKKLK